MIKYVSKGEMLREVMRCAQEHYRFTKRFEGGCTWSESVRHAWGNMKCVYGVRKVNKQPQVVAQVYNHTVDLTGMYGHGKYNGD